MKETTRKTLALGMLFCVGGAAFELFRPFPPSYQPVFDPSSIPSWIGLAIPTFIYAALLWGTRKMRSYCSKAYWFVFAANVFVLTEGQSLVRFAGLDMPDLVGVTMAMSAVVLGVLLVINERSEFDLWESGGPRLALRPEA